MKFPTRILLLGLLFATPALLLPTQEDSQETSSLVVKDNEQTSDHEAHKEDTIDDEDIGEGPDYHTEPSEAEAEAEDHETSPVHNDVEQDPEETAVQIDSSGEGLQVSSPENATEEASGTRAARKRVLLLKHKTARGKGRHAKKKNAKTKLSKRKQWQKKRYGIKRARLHRKKQQKKWRLARRKKVTAKRPPTNQTRSSESEQYNLLVDMIIQNFTASLSQKSFYEDAKVATIPQPLKILPWAYRAISLPEEAALRAAGVSEEGVAETETLSDNCTVTDTASPDSPSNVTTCILSTSDSNTTEETEEKESPETPLKEETETEEAEADENNNKVEFESDEPEETEKPEETETKTDEGVTTGEDGPADEDDDDIFVKEPHPVLQNDGSVDYYLQLVNAKLLKEYQFNREEISESDSSLHGKEHQAESSNTGSKKQGKHKIAAEHAALKKLPFNARITGFDKIKRRGDVRIADRKTVKILRIPIAVGPLKLEFTETALSVFNQTSVVTAELPALLVLKESNGKLTASRFVSKTARSNLIQVTLRLSNDDEAPSKLHAGRLVTHLSQEMTRLWNREYLLFKIGREFKEMFVAKKDKKKKAEKSGL